MMPFQIPASAMPDYKPPTTVEEALHQLDTIVRQLKLDPPMMTKVYDATEVLRKALTDDGPRSAA